MGFTYFAASEKEIHYTDDGTTQTSIKTGQTAGNYYDFSTFDDFCWISNGADRFLKYDGTSVTKASITKPEVGSFAAAEGAFFPFVRTRFNSHQAIDEGCIWIGNRSEYPLIYVQNCVAKWVCPYSKCGFVRTEPFLPVDEARKILPRLMNRVIYPDLEVSFF